MNFSKDDFLHLASEHGTPLFVYSSQKIIEQAERIQKCELPYGSTIRYAMKANPHTEIIRLLDEQGMHIDTSSSYEAQAAIDVGISPGNILLTSQQSAHNLSDLIRQGVQYDATSLHQLDLYGKTAPGTQVGIRVNPGMGSGHSTKTNTGGVGSSFGIWHEYLDQALDLAKRYNLTINRIHTHIGSGTDPSVWGQAIEATLGIVTRVPTAGIVNFGGGFKVARMDSEKETPIEQICEIIGDKLSDFADKTGRELHAELEPGTFMVAQAGYLLAAIDDIVDTGSGGYRFIKLNTGMNDILRPTLYGAQHPIEVLNDSEETEEYVVVGHNCESGDLLTPLPGQPEELGVRTMRKASIGDLVVIAGTGAYCASMSAHGYNSFPDAKEIVV